MYESIVCFQFSHLAVWFFVGFEVTELSGIHQLLQALEIRRLPFTLGVECSVLCLYCRSGLFFLFLES